MEPSFPGTVGLRELCGVAENRGSQCSCLGRELSPHGEESADTVAF